MNSEMIDIILAATQVICVAYSDEYSVDKNSLIDLQIGCRYNAVSANQPVLDRAKIGSLAIVTSQTGHMVIGVIGSSIIDCRAWKNAGSQHSFKYTRGFTPITDIIPIELVREKWASICDIHEVSKKPRYLFHARFCGYGKWYMRPLQDALKYRIFPPNLQSGTRTVF